MRNKTGKLQIEGTVVFQKNYDALFKEDEVRFIVNQGGTRSSKTYSILQLLVVYAFSKPKSRIAIYRKYKTSAGNSALPDLLQIIQDLGIWKHITFNKSTGTFKFPGGSIINIFGADDNQQLRGRKYDLVFLNEANELGYDDFLQINMRTRDKVLIDFNPSDPFSWIHERLLTDEKAILIKSTYLDNGYLPKAQVREIENLINIDDNYYRIYVLGELPIGNEFVFPKVYSTPFPKDLDFVYGMDFGFNDPTVIVQVAIDDTRLYIKEVMHESWLNSEQMIQRMSELGVNRGKLIFADSARPELIDSIKIAGWPIYKCSKGAGSVALGLDLLKRHEIHIDPTSAITYSEFRNYKYKMYKGRVTESPQSFNDHSIDATRYGATEIKATSGPRTSFYSF